MQHRIGRAEIDHADRAPGRRIVDRTEVKIGELIGREQREAPVPDRAASQVVGKVVVRGDVGGIADPDVGQRIAFAQGHPIGRAQSIEELFDIDRAEVNRRRIIASFGGIEPSKDLVERVLPGAEIDLHRRIVKQPPGLSGFGDRYDELLAAGMCQQIAPCFSRRAQPSADQRPVRRQSAQHKRPGARAQQVIERR